MGIYILRNLKSKKGYLKTMQFRYSSVESCKSSRPKIYTASSAEQFFEMRTYQPVRKAPAIPPQINQFKGEQLVQNWNKSQKLTSDDVTSTFNYMFTKIKKAIFVKIANNQLVTFLPFSSGGGITDAAVMYDMLSTLCSRRKVSDIELFLNVGDKLVMKKDVSKFSPIFSEYTNDDSVDILLPTRDDWARSVFEETGMVMPTRCRSYSPIQRINWAAKIPKASANDAARLKRYIDSGMVIPTTNLQQQSGYKYIIAQDGGTLGYELSSGSTILLVAPSLNSWYSKFLKPWVHYVPVNGDLSNLSDQILWCFENDEECAAIADRAYTFYLEYLKMDSILDYLQESFYQASVWSGPYEYPIRRASSGSLQGLIESLMWRAQINPKYMQVLTDRMDVYKQAFTAASADNKKNYEIMELLGDASANKFLAWYFFRRFPQLNCPTGVKVIARLKINYASKASFAKISESLGFWPHIKASEDHKAQDKKSLLEDVFEAFLGATEMILDDFFQVGAGYAIVNQLLTSIFDDMYISLQYEDLYDAKTRLKELFDVNQSVLGKLKYTPDPDVANQILVFREKDGVKTLMGRGSGRTKAAQEQAASKEALDALAIQGYTRKVDYSLFCE